MLDKSLKQFEESEKDLMEKLKILSCENIEHMDSRSFEAMQSTFKFMESSTRLIVDQTRAIDAMNQKLDEISRRKA